LAVYLFKKFLNCEKNLKSFEHFKKKFWKNKKFHKKILRNFHVIIFHRKKSKIKTAILAFLWKSKTINSFRIFKVSSGKKFCKKFFGVLRTFKKKFEKRKKISKNFLEV